ncbi:TPR-like protein [Vararia minispora EC-137]|uniref:TPR-like protein n=1 Tax=Vararia minispora EC-137 TaxID=1314806 RepID=A0ACB8QJT4_9AGAM|nr:TPR-like protein [Vararia minispora EC-137]
MSSDEEEYSSDFEESTASEDYDSGLEEAEASRRARPSSTGPSTGSSFVPTIEGRIEGDFDRLVQSIRIGDSDANSALLTKDWDLSIEDQEAVFREDLRAASGVGKRRGGKKGRKAGIQLSHQVKALIGEGNQAYVDGNVTKATRIMQEVIRIEPRAPAPWSVLANCYSDLGQPDKALQVRIMGAHLHHDAEEWEHLARQSREKGFNRQSLYCLSKVCSLDPENVNAFWDRAFLAKELGEHRIARNSLLAILRRHQHDLTVLEEIRPVLIELNDIKLCAELFDKAFQYYAHQYPVGHLTDPKTGAVLPGGGFGLMELLALADMYNSLGEHDRAVHVIRVGVRWLQGRQDQRFWDACEDDREYDVGTGRPVGSGVGELLPGRFPLDVNARHRLAVARIRMREFEEGAMHARIVLEQDIVHYAPLFHEIADAYFDRQMYAEAKPIYEALGHDAGTSSLDVLIQVARCHHMLGELKDAAEVYETVIAADPSANDAKMRLAEVYEVLNEPRKALDLVYQVIDSRRRKPRETSGPNQSEESFSTSLFEEHRRKDKSSIKGQNRLTPAQLQKLEQQREAETKEGYRRLCQLWPTMMLPDGAQGQAEAEREWLLEAEKLVEMFRSTRNLFTTSKVGFRGMIMRKPRRHKVAQEDEDEMASRLHLDLEHDRLVQRARKGPSPEGITVFRGVHFDDWLRLIMQYAFLLTKRGQYELAEETLTHTLCSSLARGEKMDTVRIAIVACASYAKRYTTVLDQSRKLISTHQFNNEPIRLLTASLASGFRATDAFITSTLQKALLREIRLSDAAVHNPEKLKFNQQGRRWGLPADKAGRSKEDTQEDEGQEVSAGENNKAAAELPTKDNPVLVTIYGQISLDVKSYQSALFYLLSAYEYCPDDPVICLSLAIASMGRAMQRQADNRHHLITQAMAFLTRYRELRKGDPAGLDEVEFNFGRAFQQLGLHSHAVKHYELVLQLADTRTKENPQDFGLAREAAYNLSLIYVTTGATPLAEALYRRWLSI